jgi:hypothetical protein
MSHCSMPSILLRADKNDAILSIDTQCRPFNAANTQTYHCTTTIPIRFDTLISLFSHFVETIIIDAKILMKLTKRQNLHTALLQPPFCAHRLPYHQCTASASYHKTITGRHTHTPRNATAFTKYTRQQCRIVMQLYRTASLRYSSKK